MTEHIRIETTTDDHRIAQLAALAIGLHMIEAVVPSPLPGIKPGIANIVTLYVLYRFDFALRIRQGDHVYATLSLAQQRTLEITGPLGISRIVIDHGHVRFERSPCTNQYCVHQGWLSHAGEVAICLPNQISLELLGGRKAYDSLNY